MNTNAPMKVGIVGAGNISATYVATLHMFDFVRVKSVHDISEANAAKLAGQFGLEATSLEAMLGDPEIGLVINLTTPTSHHAICKKALLAGKHVYSEKPLGVTMEEARGTDRSRQCRRPQARLRAGYFPGRRPSIDPAPSRRGQHRQGGVRNGDAALARA